MKTVRRCSGPRDDRTQALGAPSVSTAIACCRSTSTNGVRRAMNSSRLSSLNSRRARPDPPGATNGPVMEARQAHEVMVPMRKARSASRDGG